MPSPIYMLALVPTVSAPNIELVAHGAAVSPNSGAPIGPLNMTGATLIVIGVCNEDGGTAAGSIVDSSGNTYNLAPNGVTASVNSQIFYAFAPTVTSSMTFWSTVNVSVFVVGFSNTLLTSGVIDTATGDNSGANTQTWQPGSISPAVAGEVFFTVLGIGQGSQQPATINESFILLDETTFSSNSGGQSAYYVNPGSGALNPTWTAAADVNWMWSTMASFQP